MKVTLKLMRGTRDNSHLELEPCVVVSIEIIEYDDESGPCVQKALTGVRGSLESWVNSLAPDLDIAWDDQKYCFHYTWEW